MCSFREDVKKKAKAKEKPVKSYEPRRSRGGGRGAFRGGGGLRRH